MPSDIFKKNIPILGICYGLQLIAKIFGGKIKPSKKKKRIRKGIFDTSKKVAFDKKFLNSRKSVWMSHEDAVVKLPTNFKTIASTKNSKLTIIENSEKKIYGVQFHPEVTHTDQGSQIFKNFLFLICKIKKKWSVVSQKKKLLKEIRNTVKKDKVICALSGGVDSSVVALLINQAIKKNLICIMVDTGLMRKNEFKYTYKIFKNKYNLNVKLIDSSHLFLKKLKNISNPEKKEKLLEIYLLKCLKRKQKNIKT